MWQPGVNLSPPPSFLTAQPQGMDSDYERDSGMCGVLGGSAPSFQEKSLIVPQQPKPAFKVLWALERPHPTSTSVTRETVS